MAVPGLKSNFDIAQFQKNCDFRAAKSAGLEAVIIKAAQGVNFVDPQFRNHLAGAQAAGLMIGAYHFGTASDAVGQADDFLKAVNPGPDTLLALDYEENPNGTQMTIPIAEKFVARVREKTGRFPVFYCGHLFKEQMGNAKHPLFAQCPLWLAAYVRDPAPFVQKTWNGWTFWQYTNGTDGPEPCPSPGSALAIAAPSRARLPTCARFGRAASWRRSRQTLSALSRASSPPRASSSNAARRTAPGSGCGSSG